MMNATQQHVRMDVAEAGSVADRPHPPMCGAPIQALPVTAPQDRTCDMPTDRQVDRARGTRRRDDGGLVAFADDPQRPMPVFERKALDVGRAGFPDAQTVKTEQHRQGGVSVVVVLGGEQEPGQLASVHPSSLRWLTLGRRTHWAGWR
jgi:hypothetical protein